MTTSKKRGNNLPEDISTQMENIQARRRQEEEAEKKTWTYKWNKLETHQKISVIFATIAIGLSIFNLIWNIAIAPTLEPHPDTQVVSPTYSIQTSARNWEFMGMNILNNGSDETAEVTLEIRLPDNLIFNYNDTLNTKCSRPPNYQYKINRLLIYRWDYVLPHTSIDISFHLDYIGVDQLTSVIQPDHIVVSSKGEKSPRYEYTITR